MAFVYTVKKGDTLNKIANQYGFANYKAAGVSAVPSGNFDLIREGEQITLGNYDPNNITPIGSTPPVVSSKDNATGFNTDSTKLDGMLTDIGKATGTTSTTKSADTTTPTDKYTPFATGEKNAETGKIETTGDPILDKLNKWETDQGTKFSQEAAVRKAEYESLFKTSLSAIDATAAATISNINSTYDKRINEQNRINKLNIDRVKAYGLANGGQYTPISFGDAISNREQEAADKISELEGQRNSLIAQAKAARDAGESKLLRERLEDLAKVETTLRTQLADVEKEAEKQYQLLRDLRKEEETKHQKALDKMRENLAAIAPQYADDYTKLTEDEKDKFIQKIAAQTGLDYGTVFGLLEGAVSDADKKALDKKKTEADIKATDALTTQRLAGAAKDFADAATKDKDRKNDQTMRSDIPETFASEEDFNKQRLSYVKKYGEAGAKLWDEAFNKDDVGDYTYTIDPNAGGGGKSIQERAEGAGYNYAEMKKKYTDKEIDDALKAKGL